MNRSRSRWLLRLSILPVVALLIFLWSTQQRPANFLAVENRSGQAIARLQVTVGEHTRTFTDVPSGAAVTTPFAIQKADKFAVDGRLADGTLLRGRFTSQTGDEPARLVILPRGQILVRPPGRG